MKVLSVTTPESLNPYPKEIYYHMEKHYDISCDESLVKFFLPEEFDYDIIHIHWPNGLTSKLVNPQILIGTTTFNPELFSISEALAKWKRKKTKIVFTRHNEKPHEGVNEFHSVLEQLICKHADAVIHMGEYSRKSYLEDYDIRGQANTIIPHHMYEYYENNSDRETSRKKLKLSNDKLVMLIFGAVRSIQEREFASRVFNGISKKNKFLLAPRWYAEDYSRFGRLYNLYKTNLNKFKGMFKSHRYRLGDFRTSILEPDVQYYFNAADVVLIPRIDTLNSGVIPLAFAFNKAVVGPKTGNLTEILESSSNRPFNPGDHQAASAVINDLVSSNTLEEQGQRNHQYGLDHLNLADVSRKHFELYAELVQSE